MKSRSPTNVAFVHSYSALYGSEQSMLVILRHLDRTRFVPRLILVRDGPLVEAARAAGVEVDVLPWLSGARSPRLHVRLRVAARLAWWLRQRKIGLLHLNMWENGDGGTHLIAASLASAEFVLGIRCRMDDYLDRRDQFWLSRTDRVVSVSADAVQPIFSRRRFDQLWHVKPVQVTVIPPGRDLATLRATPRASDETIASLGLNPDLPIMGTIAAISINKRPDLFLRSAAIIAKAHPSMQFLMIGDTYVDDAPGGSDYFEGIRALARSLGLENKVVFAGFRLDAVALLQRYSVLVVASQSEGSSGVAIEAMALGVPVVAAAVGGLPEIFSDPASGTLVHSNDPEAFAAASERYLNDHAYTAGVIACARDAVQRHDAQVGTRRLEETYQQMLTA